MSKKLTSAAPDSRLDPANLAAVDTQRLKTELANALKLTANHLLYLAAIWAELEKRGEDLSDLRKGIGRYIARIAAGTLLADIVVMFADEPDTLRRLSALGLDDQREVLASGVLPWDKIIPPSPAPPPGPTPKPQHSAQSSPATAQKVLPVAYRPIAEKTVGEAVGMCMDIVENHPNKVQVARALKRYLEVLIQKTEKPS